MNTLFSTPAARLGDVQLSLGQALRVLKNTGKLRALLQRTLRQEFLLDEARKVGARVESGELQSAADAFRQRRGLISAQQTHAWLSQAGLSVQDFEDNLERGLLIQKLKHLLAEPKIHDYFAHNRGRYGVVKLRQVVLAREDLAKELLMQLREEDRPFSELVREHPLANNHNDLPAMTVGRLPAFLADAIAAARQGDIVGPVPSPHGFHLVLVEALQAPTLDARTVAQIRRDIFDEWLKDRLQNMPVTLPLLDLL